MPIDRKILPRDPDALTEMVVDLSKQVDKMQRQLDYLIRQNFGRRSEKLPRIDGSQGRLYPTDACGDDPEDSQADTDTAEEGTAGKKNEQPKPDRKKKRQGEDRPSLPRHLPRVERQHTLDNLKPCSCCGKVPTMLGDKGEYTDILEYVPSSYHVIRDIRYTYACGCGETIVTSNAPMRPIIGGLPGTGMLASVLTNKYADHLPLHRQEGILERNGIEISRSVLCGWIKHCYELLLPIYVALKVALLELDYVGFDATHVKVQEKGRGRAHEGTMWAYRSARDIYIVVLEYTRTHNKDAPLKFLEGFTGYLQADAHPHHDALFKKHPERKEVACWSHARRPLERIIVRAKGKKRSSQHARAAIGFIQVLFEIERDAVTRELDPGQRLALRLEKSRPVLTEFRKWLDETLKICLPRTDLGRALHYIDRNWEALSRFLEDGRLEIHNNFVEQELRKIAIGRNNWVQFGNENGARWGALMFSIVASCRRAGVDPFLYFYDVLERISTHSRVEDLLPHNWKARFQAEAQAKIEFARAQVRAATTSASQS